MTAKITAKPKAAKTPKFAEGLGFKKLFFVFLIGSVFGTLYEEILYGAQSLLQTGEWAFALRRGVIYGPFNVIYGFGAVVLIYLLLRKPLKDWQIFVYAALLGGVVEYVIGWLQETFTHTTSWDYSDMLLNINGRTAVPIMAIWGVLGLALVKIVYPFLSNLIEKIPVDFGNQIFPILLILMALDMLVSWTAIIRQTLRHNDIPPFTPVGEFYDYYYNDTRLQHYFPNMSHPDKQK